MASDERTDRMGYSVDAALTVGQWSGTDGIDRFPSGSIPDEEDG